MDNLIDSMLKTIKNLKNICVIGNNKYEIKLKQYDNVQIHILDINSMSFFDMRKFVECLEKNILIIILMPFNVKTVSKKEMFNWLMKLEEEKNYFINVFTGIENQELTYMGQKNYNKLLLQVISQNHQEIICNNQKYKEILKKVKEKKLRIKDSYGSDFSFKIYSILEETNIFDENNRVLQIPFGEVFIVPQNKSVNGKIVIIWEGEKKLVYVKDDFLDFSFDKQERKLPVSEIGFGTNPFIPKIYNLPYYEKKYKTYHIGVGNNANFGGTYKYDLHFDLVIDAEEWSIEVEENGWSDLDK